MMKKNVRLEDIAKRLNLTKVSISKALRDHPDISLETRKKVKKLADEMGYFPNQVARSLTSRRTRTIGVIVPKIAHFFFSYVIEGIYNAATENNYERSEERLVWKECRCRSMILHSSSTS